MNFQADVANELARARAKHPTPQVDVYEGYAVLLEEVDEFWDLVKAQKPAMTHVYDELVQIAAMAERMAVETCSSGQPSFAVKVLEKLSRFRRKYLEPLSGLHQAYGILSVYVNDLFLVLGTDEEFFALVKIAAFVQRIAEDVLRDRKNYSPQPVPEAA